MRGKLTPLTGTEIFRTLQAGHEATHQINMRFTDQLDTTMQLRIYDTAYSRYRYFTPLYVLDPQNRHTQLNIFVKEILPEA
jgi:hypothetical protein